MLIVVDQFCFFIYDASECRVVSNLGLADV